MITALIGAFVGVILAAFAIVATFVIAMTIANLVTDRRTPKILPHRVHPTVQGEQEERRNTNAQPTPIRPRSSQEHQQSPRRR
jgi:hypothetical protein